MDPLDPHATATLALAPMAAAPAPLLPPNLPPAPPAAGSLPPPPGAETSLDPMTTTVADLQPMEVAPAAVTTINAKSDFAPTVGFDPLSQTNSADPVAAPSAPAPSPVGGPKPKKRTAYFIFMDEKRVRAKENLIAAGNEAPKMGEISKEVRTEEVDRGVLKRGTVSLFLFYSVSHTHMHFTDRQDVVRLQRS